MLLDNPLTQQRLSDVHASTIAASVMINGMAKILDEDKGSNPNIIPMEAYAAVKSFGSEYCVKTVDQLVQLLGGRGYTDNNYASRLLRDTRIFRVFEGPTEVLNAFLGASFTHKSTSLKKFIVDTLNLKSIYKEMEAVASELSVAVSELNVDNKSRQWLKYAVGELAGLFIVKDFLMNSR